MGIFAPTSLSSDLQPVQLATEGDVEVLLRQIIEIIDVSPAQADSAAHLSTEEIVVEVVAGRNRYVLTRTPQPIAGTQTALSPREKEIVRLVAKGLPNKIISDVLEISPWTVATHLRRIFAKLGVGSRTEMIAHVINDRLLDSRR